MFSVGEHNYGTSNPAKKKYAPGVTNVNFNCPKFDRHYR